MWSVNSGFDGILRLCGAEQDVKSFFEQREEEVVKKEIAIKEISDDEIVSGTADFAATEEFGHDEDDLESEWDENIAVAEEAVDQAWERRNADDIALEEMTQRSTKNIRIKLQLRCKQPRNALLHTISIKFLQRRVISRL